MTEEAKKYGRGGARKGSGRKALGTEKRIQISPTLPPIVYAKLIQLAGATGKLQSDIIIEALEAWFEKPGNKALLNPEIEE